MNTPRMMRAGGAALAMLLAVILGGGCARSMRVIPLGSQTVAALTAEDVARVMRRAGFSDDQILEMGTDVRNALSTTGAAKVRVGKKVEAILAINGHSVQATSRRRGSFTYDFRNGRFR